MSTATRAEQAACFASEGLHARPAAEIVKLSKRFASNIELIKGPRTATARSSLKLMLLGVQVGEPITVRAEGPDAERAVQELVALIEGWAGEAPPSSGSPPPPATTPSPLPAGTGGPLPAPPRAGDPARVLTGTCGAPGAASGPAFLLLAPPLEVPRERLAPAAIEGECARLELALRSLVAELRDVTASKEAGSIVAALMEVAGDAELQGAALARVREGHHPVAAILEAGEAIAGELARLEDPYVRARAEDVRAVSRRAAAILCGCPLVDPLGLTSPSIVVAPQLSPWDLARLPAPNILGIVTAEGGATSHVAIIARSLGVPALLGVSLEPARLAATSRVALDADRCLAILDPTPEEEAETRRRMEYLAQERRALEVYRTVEPRTRGGRPVVVAANLGALAEIPSALAFGAAGVGLFRTELLFMERGAVPDEEKQLAVYEALARAFPGHRVVIRTVDIGGDKVMPGIVDAAEANPFLGWRGIRMSLDRPDLFRPQLRALLRAAVHGNVDIMFPMISDAREVERARATLSECERELQAAGVAAGRPGVGIMVETPAAALCAPELARMVDFFSIGTNDLTQYVMAADRMNPRLAHLMRADHPAVLRMMEMTCSAARSAGIRVAVCGEAASNPVLIPALVAMGVDELSMSAPAIPRAKQVVTGCP